MNAASQVRKPSHVQQNGKFGFFALIRGRKNTALAVQRTKYHSLGGYLCRATVRPSLENRGETVAVFLNCEGPDASKIAPPSRITPYWCIVTHCEITLVHPSTWRSLGITDEDISGEEENVSRICRFELEQELGKDVTNYTKAVACKTNAPDVEINKGFGKLRFVPYAAIQNGLFGDEFGNFVLHFAVHLNTHFDDNETNTEHSYDFKVNKASYDSKTATEMLSDALQLRAEVMHRILEYDSKLKSVKNEVVLGIVRKEIEYLYDTTSKLPEISDFM